MGRFLIALLLLAILFCGLATAVLRPTIDRTAVALIEQQNRTDPMASLLAYHGTPERRTSPLLWIAVGSLPFVVLLGVLAYMRGAADFLRERRLSKRKRPGARPAAPPIPAVPLPPTTITPPLPGQPPHIPLPPRSDSGENRW